MKLIDILDILNINAIYVNTDLTSGCYNDGKQVQFCYSFFPNVAPGFKIVENITNPVYLPISLTNFRYSIYLANRSE